MGLKSILMVSAIGLATIMIAPVADAGGKLTGAEIKAELIGKTWSYRGKSTGTTVYGANGTVSYTDKKWGSDSGTWWIKGNKWCRKYKKNKKVQCLTYTRLGRSKYKTNSGYTMTPK